MSLTNPATPMATLYQRESEDDAAGARKAMDQGDTETALRRQRHAWASSAMARRYHDKATGG